MSRAIAFAVSSSEETTKSTSSWRSCQTSRYSTFCVRTIVRASGESRSARMPATMLTSSRDVQAMTRSASTIPASLKDAPARAVSLHRQDVIAIREGAEPGRVRVDDRDRVLLPSASMIVVPTWPAPMTRIFIGAGIVHHPRDVDRRRRPLLLLAAFPTASRCSRSRRRPQPLGLTGSSVVAVAASPPLVGVGIRREAAMHELLREAAAFSFSLLAGDQEAVAEHFARGVPPIGLWEGIDLHPRRDAGAPLIAGALGWLDCVHETEIPAAPTRFLAGRVVRAEAGRAADGSRPRPRPVARRVIDAVVFDLDGVLLDSEAVWDAAREALARERGGRWHDQAQRDMMGMSSTEWSRYMHEVVGLEESPDEINAEVVEPDGGALSRAAAARPGAVEAVERLAARGRSVWRARRIAR